MNATPSRVSLLTLVLAAAPLSLVPAQEAQPAATEADKKKITFDQDDWSAGWKGTIDFGLNGSDGNSETLSLRAGVAGKRTTEKTESKADISYVYATSDGEKSKSRGELNLRNDWFIKDSNWGFFALGKAEYDEFQDWHWRLSAFAGPSYAFIKDDRTLLRGRVGAGGAYKLGGSENGFEPEGLLGVDFTHKITERQSVFANVDYYPSLSDFPDFRVDAKAGYQILVDPEVNMLLKIGVNDRYDSSPGGDRKRNDIEYFATLAWTF